MEKNPDPKIIDDLCNIDPLNDAEILLLLRMRYEKNLIYVNCGPTMLMTNPYKDIRSMLTKDIQAYYQNFAKKGGKLDEMTPHIWSLAAKTFF